jgi:hypothetical protein
MIVHLIWMRVPGDSWFAIGALLYAWFVLRLWIAPWYWVCAAVSSAGSDG